MSSTADFSVSLWLVSTGFLLLAFAIGWWAGRRQGHAGPQAERKADIDLLRTALAESEQRCQDQAEWIANLEGELVALKTPETGKTTPPFSWPPIGPSKADTPLRQVS